MSSDLVSDSRSFPDLPQRHKARSCGSLFDFDEEQQEVLSVFSAGFAVAQQLASFLAFWQQEAFDEESERQQLPGLAGLSLFPHSLLPWQPHGQPG